MTRHLFTAFIALLGLPGAVPAAEPQVPLKEPVYESKEPRYCRLVFGPKADATVWLVIDGDTLYVDRKGDGDLTGPGKRFTRRPAFQGGGFEVKSLELGGKTTYSNLIVYWTPGQPKAAMADTPIDVMLDVDGKFCQYAIFKARTDTKLAPVIHFDGPLEMVLLAPTLPLPLPGKERQIEALIGTRSSTNHLAMVRHDRQLTPKADAHPIADIVFSPAKPGAAPLRIKLPLDQRCCNVRFLATLKTPAEAGTGPATLELAFPDWAEAKVAGVKRTLPLGEVPSGK